MGSFRDELEYDFATKLPGANFGELWRLRKWKKLLSLIDQLPRNSRYRQALSEDEAMAEQYLREYKRDPEAVGEAVDDTRPDMSEFDLQAELLLDLLNEIKAMRAENVGLQTGKAPPKPRFRKGPLTAYETVGERLEHEQHDVLVATLTPRDEHGNRIAPVLADPVPELPQEIRAVEL